MEARLAGESERWRCFLAVELPTAVQDRLEGPLGALSGLGRLVRSNPKDRIHLTLHFLGNVEPARLTELTVRLAPVAESAGRFSVVVRGVGAFPSMARPRTLWSGIEGPQLGQLLELHARLGTALAAAGFVPEERVFSPHLTLARLRRPPAGAERRALARWHQEWSGQELGTIEVTEVSLMRSELSAGPPRYTRLQSYELQ